ncbi:MAG TPA: glycosyltransferase [Candidatus Saccharimonadales bacterium]
MLILFGGAVVLELLVYLFGAWAWLRRGLAVAALTFGGIAAGALLAFWPNLFSAVIALLSLYRLVNMMRVVQGRMHERYLRWATFRTGLILLIMQGVIFGGWWAWSVWHVTGHGVWALLAGVQALVAVVFLVSVRRNLRKTRWPAGTKHYSDSDLPTVSVLIPARNETQDLQECLQTLVASDYPKLEIVVLDDCSQLRKTPEIIKDFAQAGVRFVQGQEPAETWLPKNQAYDRLAKEASGTYLLFCGADIRFEHDAIRRIVSTMLERHKQMLCVLPTRQASAYGRFSPIQAMRYWWELVPPRRMFARPPVISSCWSITRQALQKSGGFAAVARAIVPEAHFARELLTEDGYSFLRANGGLGVVSIKQVSDQRDTAVRMRYPQLHRRPEQVALLTIFELAFLLLPFVLVVAGFWVSIGWPAHVLAGLSGVMLLVTYHYSVQSTHVSASLFGWLGQPLAAATDIGLVHYSMWRYEFSTIDWRGRNVCIPVMHVVSHLPGMQKEKT